MEWAREVLGFEPDLKQQEVLSANTQRGILNCSRQWGKSTTCAIKAVHYAHFHPDSLVVVASPSFRQSGEFIRKAGKPSRHSGSAFAATAKINARSCCPTARASSAFPKAKTPSAASPQVGLLIIDEAARVSDEMYYALRPMLAVGGGSLWLMSTPNGQSGFFYREWSGSREWTRVQATAEECPRIPKEFLHEERETLGEEVFRQEYCCDFVSGEGTLFDEAQIRSKLSYRLAPLW